jgi:FixJ family two-component response regulator
MSETPSVAIIEDDGLAREGMRELVESLGYRPLTFSSAEDFLQSGTIEETSCLITDLRLPGQSGLELQEMLHLRGYQIPLILITAYPNENDRTRAINNGAVDFLSKPFDEKWLVECLNDAIKLHDKSVSNAARSQLQ